MNSSQLAVLLVVDEISQLWDYNENADWKQDQEFLSGLHDPTIEGKELLSGLLDHDPELTDAQWGEALRILRRKFPLVPECSICYDPSVGTYGPSNEPLCGDCRDEEGFCSCGDVLKECEACKEPEEA